MCKILGEKADINALSQASVIASYLIGKMMDQLNDRVGSVGTPVVGIAIVKATR